MCAGDAVPHRPGTGTASHQATSPQRHAEGFSAVPSPTQQHCGDGDGDEDAGTATRWLAAWWGIGVREGQGPNPKLCFEGRINPGFGVGKKCYLK